MKNFFKRLKEKIVDFANYNTDEVVSDKKSEVGKQTSTPPKSGPSEKEYKSPRPSLKKTQRPGSFNKESGWDAKSKEFSSGQRKTNEFKAKEPDKTGHSSNKTGKTAFRKRENAVENKPPERKKPSGRSQDKSDKSSKRKNGYKKYKNQGR